MATVVATRRATGFSPRAFGSVLRMTGRWSVCAGSEASAGGRRAVTLAGNGCVPLRMVASQGTKG